MKFKTGLNSSFPQKNHLSQLPEPSTPRARHLAKDAKDPAVRTVARFPRRFSTGLNNALIFKVSGQEKPFKKKQSCDSFRTLCHFSFSLELCFLEKTRDSQSPCFERTRKGHLSSPGSLAPRWLSLAVFTFLVSMFFLINSTWCRETKTRSSLREHQDFGCKAKFSKREKSKFKSIRIVCSCLFSYDLLCIFVCLFLCLSRGHKALVPQRSLQKPYQSFMSLY